jgi:2-polyprenyl-6-methoxyphenol hydroxylase-like FAD-dependent oxidoreductase
MGTADVLVVGAGPTGMTLALQAHAYGARVRIIERRSEAFRPSRALILHPRTLEALRPLGVTDTLLAQADVAPEGYLHLGSRVVRARLTDFALPDTAFPYLSLVRQMDVEMALAQTLADRGIEVERGVELINVRDGLEHAVATLRTESGLETVACDFVAGCDGPESVVRRATCIGWRGGEYRQEVVLADVELDADLARGVAHVVSGRRGLVFVFALGERGTWRLLATVPARHDQGPFGQPSPGLTRFDLQELLNGAGLDARITHLAWTGRYRLQHRLAARMRQGRLFLVGDAAHAFSPATGQGMNTGIQDAINLGWKLAFAPTAGDREGLLDSYELERRPVARATLALTHVAFWFEASTDPVAALLRSVVVPLGAPTASALLSRRWLVAEGIRWMSGLRIAYIGSPLSCEGTTRLLGSPRPGHRLPDATVTTAGQCVRLHTLLAQPGIHVLLCRDAEDLESKALGPYVFVHRLTSEPGAGLMAIRPDGYVGFRSGIASASQVGAWLAGIGASRSRLRNQEPDRNTANDRAR